MKLGIFLTKLLNQENKSSSEKNTTVKLSRKKLIALVCIMIVIMLINATASIMLEYDIESEHAGDLMIFSLGFMDSVSDLLSDGLDVK